MSASLRHVGIVVKNLDKCKAFWVDLMGYEIERECLESGEVLDAIVDLENVKVTTVKLRGRDGSMIELLKFHSHLSGESWQGNAHQTGLTHVAMNVDDLSVLYEQRAQNGLRFKNPPQLSPDGKVRVSYCNGPEGLLLELVESLS